MKRIWKEIIDNLKKKWNDIKKNKVHRYAKNINRQKEHLSKLERANGKLKKEFEKSDREYFERNSLKSFISDWIAIPSYKQIQIGAQENKLVNISITSSKDVKPGTYKIVILSSGENQVYKNIVEGKYICKGDANNEDLVDNSITYRKKIYENKLKNNKINYSFSLQIKRDLWDFYITVNEDDIKSILSYIDSSQFRKPEEDEDDGTGTGVRSKK